MINILLCGNYKVFDGALTELISITNKTKEAINCYIFTMDASNLKPEFTCITDKQIEFLNNEFIRFYDENISFIKENAKAEELEIIKNLEKYYEEIRR